jgi:hypothetical protein
VFQISVIVGATISVVIVVTAKSAKCVVVTITEGTPLLSTTCVSVSGYQVVPLLSE